MPAALRSLAVVAALALTWLFCVASGHAQTPTPSPPSTYQVYIPQITRAPQPVVPPNPRVVAQVRGDVHRSLAYTDGHLYLITTDHLQVYDLSDPTQPRLIGQTQRLADQLNDIVVDGHYAYLADRGAGLVIVNIHNPASPYKVGQLALDGETLAIAYDDRLAYLAGLGGLHIVDVSDRTAPRARGRYTGSEQDVPLRSGAGITLDSHYAYIANNGDYSLWIVDVADPDRPRLAGRARTAGGAAVALYERIALVAIARDGVDLYDVHEPDDIRQVSTIQANDIWEVFEVNGRAYVCARWDDEDDAVVRIYNVKAPDRPTLLARLPYDVREVFATGQLAFFALTGGGFLVYDVAVPETPRLLSVVGQTTHAIGVTVDGPTAYISDTAFGLFVYDVSNPEQPVTRGTLLLTPPPGVQAVSAAAGLVAVTGPSTVRLIDSRDPTRPHLVGTWAAPGWVRHVRFLTPTHLAVTADRLYVLDVSNPATPRPTAALDVDAFPYRLTGGLPWLYMNGSRYNNAVPTGLDLLWVIDLSNLSTPQVVGHVELPKGTAYDPLGPLTLVGPYVYQIHDRSGLAVVDVSDPTRPLVVGALPALTQVYDLAAAEDTLLGLGAGALAAVNIRTPLTPGLLGWYSVPGWPGRIAVSGDYAFIAGGEEGLVVLKLW